MGDGLTGKAGVEVAEGHVADQRGGENRRKGQQQAGLPEQHEVTDAAHHAQAGALGDGAHDEARRQTDEQRRVLGAGAFLREVDKGRGQRQQHQQRRHDGGQHGALGGGQAVGAAQGVALVQEEHAAQDARHEAGQPEQRVAVAARQTQNHAEGAAKEHQAADHDEEAQHEPGHGSAAALGGPLLTHQREDQAAQHQTDDLRPDVLHGGGAVQAHRTGDVPYKAGDAEAHVGGVAQQHQHCRNDADAKARRQRNGKFFFVVHRKIPPSL